MACYQAERLTHLDRWRKMWFWAPSSSPFERCEGILREALISETQKVKRATLSSLKASTGSAFKKPLLLVQEKKMYCVY